MNFFKSNKNVNKLFTSKTFYILNNLVFIIITFSVFFITALEIYYGRIPFWYDAARDMLLGLQNLDKPTLIGQPTGIPGVFYGPYWVWLISFFEIFNKSPRFIAIALLLIPYFTLFLIILIKLGKVISRESSILIWLLFILSFGRYFSFIWNPHLTPLFLLLFIYLIIKLDFKKVDFKNLAISLFSGFALGLSANFSMSIGVGLILGTFIFLVFQFIYLKFKIKNMNSINYLIVSTALIAGVALSFSPFLIFEFRHGFNQINSYLDASLNKIVGLSGLSDRQIIMNFLNIPKKIFLIPSIIFYSVIFFTFIILKLKKARISKMSDKEIMLMILLNIILISVLGVYLFSKNPVWEYHFIGFELILLLIFGIIINRHIIFKVITLIVVVILFLLRLFNFSFIDNVVYDDSLKSKELAINTVLDDSGKNNFSYFAYSPSIYTFEYDYLFQKKSKDKINSKDTNDLDLVYIIIEKNYLNDVKGFVESRTNNTLYKTTKTLKTSNGTLIIRRELIVK